MREQAHSKHNFGIVAFGGVGLVLTLAGILFIGSSLNVGIGMTGTGLLSFLVSSGIQEHACLESPEFDDNITVFSFVFLLSQGRVEPIWKDAGSESKSERIKIEIESEKV